MYGGLVSFSAHVDFFQNFSFVEATRPDNIVLVHGEKNEMDRLKGKLVQETNKWPSDRRPTVFAGERPIGEDEVPTRPTSSRLRRRLAISRRGTTIR